MTTLEYMEKQVQKHRINYERELAMADDWKTAHEIANHAKYAPTIDAVPVVRCKDCKYIRPEVDAYTQEAVGCWCSFLDLGSIEDEHFCSYGERRDTDA